jgi:16S rRNA (cytosine1402-N4)-methyltransferase
MHITVLKEETIDNLLIKNGDIVVDGTLGGGGHTEEIIRRYGNKVRIIGFDLDSDAINNFERKIDKQNCDIIFINKNFAEMVKELNLQGIKKIDRLLLDLGISSSQIEESKRGFSFKCDEPLLMTMKSNPSENDLTAYDIVNTWSEETLVDILFGFGEEKYSRKIAKAIINARSNKEIKTTFELVEIINLACGQYYKRLKIHPATRTFQALRIAVNMELANLEKVIEQGFEILNKNGRMAIISFHSIEDRIVKRSFQNFKNFGLGKIITKKPHVPSINEQRENPRSRSAKLRVIEKIIN